MIPRYYLSVAAVCKNEHHYLPEWIEFHQLVGVEHFFIFDNGSTPPLYEVLWPYVYDGLVTVIDAPGPMDRFVQEALYTRALWEFGPSSVWMAFIDVDEFLFPKLTKTVAEFLLPFEEYAGGVRVSWQVFGSSGHQVRPPGLQMEAMVHRAARDWHRVRNVKTIVQPARTARNHVVHHFEYRSPFQSHDEHGRVEGPGVSVDKIQINHYWLRSRAEFREKYCRHPDSWKDGRNPTQFDTFDSQCDVPDVSMAVRFGAKVRNALALRGFDFPEYQYPIEISNRTSAGPIVVEPELIPVVQVEEGSSVSTSVVEEPVLPVYQPPPVPLPPPEPEPPPVRALLARQVRCIQELVQIGEDLLAAYAEIEMDK